MLTSSVWQGEATPAAGVWWGSTRGSPSAGLMRKLGSGMDVRAPATEQQLELRGRAGFGEGAVDAGRGRGRGG